MVNEGLVLDNQLLVYHLIHHYGFTAPRAFEFEDLVQEGMLGLIYAARTFDPTRGISFSNYAGVCIYNALAMFLRRQKRHPHTESLDCAIKNDERGEEGRESYVDLMPGPAGIGGWPDDPEDWAEHLDQREIIRRARALEPEIMDLYLAGVPQAKIAEMMSLSQSYISRRIRRAVQRALAPESAWAAAPGGRRRGRRAEADGRVPRRAQRGRPAGGVAAGRGRSEAAAVAAGRN